jgi:hypothetical protein
MPGPFPAQLVRPDPSRARLGFKAGEPAAVQPQAIRKGATRWVARFRPKALEGAPRGIGSALRAAWTANQPLRDDRPRHRGSMWPETPSPSRAGIAACPVSPPHARWWPGRTRPHVGSPAPGEAYGAGLARLPRNSGVRRGLRPPGRLTRPPSGLVHRRDGPLVSGAGRGWRSTARSGRCPSSSGSPADRGAGRPAPAGHAGCGSPWHGSSGAR